MSTTEFLLLAVVLAVVASVVYQRWVPVRVKKELQKDWTHWQPVADDLVVWAESFGPTSGPARFAIAVEDLSKILESHGVVAVEREVQALIIGAFARQTVQGHLAAVSAPPSTPVLAAK